MSDFAAVTVNNGGPTMTFPASSSIDRVPLKKRSRQHLIVGQSARQRRRAEAAIARLEAKRRAKAGTQDG